MTCDEFKKNLLSGSVDLAACEQHLVSCKRCSLTFETQFKLEKALQKMTTTVMPVDISDNIRALINERHIQKKRLSAIQIILWSAIIVSSIVSLGYAIPRLITMAIRNWPVFVSANSNVSSKIMANLDEIFAFLSVEKHLSAIFCLALAGVLAVIVLALHYRKDIKYFMP